MTKLVFYKVLDVGTKHIRRSDSKLLEMSDGPVVTYEFGAFVRCWDDAEYYENHGFSLEFVSIIFVALAADCTTVNFDADGPVYDCFPIFDW